MRAEKKADYINRIEATKPKPLEGTYRILYIDPPWKYHGLNQADEYGHAEAHYDCLDDNQLMEFKPDSKRLIKDLADDNAVLFVWVTAPLLKRCFPIIEAWGFDYKANFVWDKEKHVMGFYNSVRHEHLLIATKGSCTPDVKKLYDSVQPIKRTEHSRKPHEFYDIIESSTTTGASLNICSQWPRGMGLCRQRDRRPRRGCDLHGREGGSVTTSPANSPLLTVTESAQYLRCSASHLNKLRVTGGDPMFVKIGARVLYARADLDEWNADGKAERINGEYINGGLVYFIESGEFIKIGFTSKSVGNRISDLSVATPHDLTVLATIPGTLKTEAKLHRRFAPSRHKREWFRKTPELMAFIPQLSERVAA